MITDKEPTKNSNGTNTLLTAVPMWTMIAEHGFRHHFATNDFRSFCGRDNLLVRDYVELVNGKMRLVGEGRQVFDAIPEWSTCKICLRIAKRHCR